MALDGLRLRAASEETVKQAQLMALKAFAQQVLRIHILMFLHGSVLHGSPFIQRAIETKRRDFFFQLPAIFRSRSQGIRRTYFPASSGGL